MSTAFALSVRPFIALVFFAFTGLSLGVDWRATLNTKAGRFPALRPLTATYDFGWSGMKAAEAEAKFARQKGQCRLDLNAQTVGAVRGLWRMDMDGFSTVNAAALRPIKLWQKEVFAEKTITTTVDFKAEGPVRLKVADPPDPKPPKPRQFKFTPMHDLHSALLFIRSLPLQQGAKVRLCVFPASSSYLTEVTVLGRQKLKAAGQEWDAIRCGLKLWSVNKDLTLGDHKKFKRAVVWLSDDQDRLLLRAEAEIFVGKIWVELKKVEFAEKN